MSRKSERKHTSTGPDEGGGSIYITPPPATDATPPAFANQVRVIGGADAMVVHLYFVSATQVASASEGRAAPGVRKEGNTIYVESEPVARIALPLSTAAELAMLIIKNVAEGTPRLVSYMTQIGTQIGESVTRAAAMAAEQAGTEKPGGD